MDFTLPLSDYAEHLFGFKLREAQRLLCLKLEQAFTRRNTRAVIHAPAQCGLSLVLEIAYPAWLLGHEPFHRIGLASYSKYHSGATSRRVIDAVISPSHEEAFGTAIMISGGPMEWRTSWRDALKTTNASFRSLSLHAGMCGTAFDTLIQTDRFRSQHECLSAKACEEIERFEIGSARPRLGGKSNNFIVVRHWESPPRSPEYLKNFELWQFPWEAKAVAA